MVTQKWLWLFAFCAQAASAKEISREYRSARYLGMGDAGVSIPEGHDSLFYNPAGIADVKTLVNEIVVASPQVIMSSNAKTLYNDVKSDKSPMQIVSGFTNKPEHVEVQNFSGVVFKRAAFGVFQRVQVDAFVGTDPLRGVMVGDLNATARAGAMFSFGRSFMKDNLLLGTNLKLVHKAELDFTLDALSAQEKIKSFKGAGSLSSLLDRGTGFGADIGAIYKFEGESKPRIGLVLRNAGGLKYSWPVPATGNSPTAEKQTIDVGLSMQPGTKRSYSTLAIDLLDAANANKEIIYKRLHMGAKLSLQDVVGGFVGLNQGYITYGGFVNFKFIRAEVGMFSEELEKYPGDRRSKRMFGRLVVGWVR